MNKRDALINPESFGTTMLIALIDAYGTECIQWEPETVRKEVEQDYKVNLTASNMDRIMAAMSAMTSTLFFVSLEAFNNTCEALNFGAVSGDRFIPCELDDILWGCTEIRLLLGAEEYDNADWSHDTRKYTGTQLSSESITKAPDILSFAEFGVDEIDNKDALLASDQMLAAAYQSRQSDTLDQLNKEAIIKLQRLLQQVASLRLSNGRTEEVATLLDDIKKKIAGNNE